jgi:hypothetical protein
MQHTWYWKIWGFDEKVETWGVGAGADISHATGVCPQMHQLLHLSS